MFSFIFDTSKGETPQSIALKRALAARIMGGGGNRSAQNVGEGVGNALNSIGLGIAANVMNRRANSAEQAGMAGADSLKDRFVDMMIGGQSFPPAPSPDGSVPMPDAPQTFGGTGGTATAGNWDASSVDPSIKDGIVSTASALGIDPVDLATAISYETAGTFDPTKSGPRTQWGRHRGLIQFGEPQAARYGVNWDDPVGSQLGPEGAVANYLRDTGVKPGMGLLDIYSAINAGGVGRYNRSDANNGGAPGTVRDKVEQQMAGHRAKAAALIGQGAAPAAAPAAAQAAPGPLPLLDDYFDARWGGPPQAPEETMLPEIGVEGDMPPDASAMFSPQPMTGGAPMPMMPGQSPGPDAVQVAQADPGRLEMSGMVDRAPQPDFGLLFDALNNPFLPPEIKSFAVQQLEQHMQARDPRHQLDMDYRRAQLAKMQEDMERGELINAGSGRLYNRRTGEWITAPGAEGGNSELGLNPQYGVDAEGNPVLLQLGKDGRVVQSEMPEGVSLSREPIKMDAGTHFVLLDPITRQPVGTVPKENYQEAFDTASGSNDAKSAAEARANLPKVEDNATAILGMIESLSTDPYLDSMVGPVSGRLPNVSADAARVQSKMDQIGGQAFLQAFETLRGGGQISNVEGERATAALARLNTAQSPQDYRQALEELSAIVRASLSRARRSAGSGSGNNPPPGASGDGWQDMGGVRIRRKQ